MKFPDKLDVLTVHARLIAESGGIGGLRDEGLLESALVAAEFRYHSRVDGSPSCSLIIRYP
jgi:prophage maintenance system killer protein